MFVDHFGFQRRPFNARPDKRSIYWTDENRRGARLFDHAIGLQAPLAVLTGSPGLGKTTLVRHFLGSVPKNATIGLVSNYSEGFGDILEWILLSFGQEIDVETRIARVSAVERFVAAEHRAGRIAVLVIDEAQNLSLEDLETLRLLGNLNVDEEARLCLILVGQPGLREKLSDPKIEQVAQRVALDFHLSALTRDQVAGFIRHAIEQAGGPPGIFSDGAIGMIYRFTGGIPRSICLLADLCLTAAYAEDRHSIYAAMVKSVISEAKRHGTFASVTQRQVAGRPDAGSETKAIVDQPATDRPAEDRNAHPAPSPEPVSDGGEVSQALRAVATTRTAPPAATAPCSASPPQRWYASTVRRRRSEARPLPLRVASAWRVAIVVAAPLLVGSSIALAPSGQRIADPLGPSPASPAFSLAQLTVPAITAVPVASGESSGSSHLRSLARPDADIRREVTEHAVADGTIPAEPFHPQVAISARSPSPPGHGVVPSPVVAAAIQRMKSRTTPVGAPASLSLPQLSRPSYDRNMPDVPVRQPVSAARLVPQRLAFSGMLPLFSDLREPGDLPRGPRLRVVPPKLEFPRFPTVFMPPLHDSTLPMDIGGAVLSSARPLEEADGDVLEADGAAVLSETAPNPEYAPIPVSRPLPPEPERDPEPGPAVESTGSTDRTVLAAAEPADIWVVVHHGSGSADRARAVLDRLRTAGFNDIEAREVPFSITSTNVRYFFEPDRTEASRVMTAVAEVGGNGPAGTPRDFTAYSPLPRHGTVEVWLQD